MMLVLSEIENEKLYGVRSFLTEYTLIDYLATGQCVL